MAALKAYSEGEQLARENKQQGSARTIRNGHQGGSRVRAGVRQTGADHHAMGYGEQAEQVARKAAHSVRSYPRKNGTSSMRFGPESSTIRKRPSKRTSGWRSLRPATRRFCSTWPDCTRGQGDLDRARDTFKRVLDLDPKYVAALIAIGQVEIRRRDFDQALNYLNPAYSEQFRLGTSPRRVRRCTR